MNYIEILGELYPEVQAYATGPAYKDIVWQSGPVITKADLDAAHLQVHKNVKKGQINNEREDRISGGMWYMGHFFDTDQRSRENINGMINALTVGAALPSGFTWRDHNNHDIVMDKQQLVTFGLLMTNYVSQIYKASWAIKAKVDACSTIDEVDGFDTKAGWPSNNLDGSGTLSCSGPVY